MKDDLWKTLAVFQMERQVIRIESARQLREGGGFLVRRPIGGKVDQCDPFLLLDHLGPVVYEAGEAVGAPDHPHRGFETVTYLIDGKKSSPTAFLTHIYRH